MHGFYYYIIYLFINTCVKCFLGANLFRTKEAIDRTFVCEQCHKAYVRKQALMSHQKYECGKEPQFQCPLQGCNYRCKLNGNLKLHMKRRHNIT